MNIKGYVATLLNALPHGVRQPVQQAFDAVLGEQSGVTAGTYGSSLAIPVLTIDGRGRVTAASESTFAGSTSVGNYTYSSAAGNEPTANAGDLYFPTNGFYTERYTGTTWHQWGPLWPMVDPNAYSWSWVNQSSAYVITSNGGVFLRGTQSSAVNIRARVKSVPTAPYQVTAAFIPLVTTANYSAAGLCLRDSGTGKLVLFDYLGEVNAVEVSKWSSPTAAVAAYATNAAFRLLNAVFWFRITDDNTNRTCSYSMDGVNYADVHVVGRTDYITPDQIGFFVKDQNATYFPAMTVLSWKET